MPATRVCALADVSDSDLMRGLADLVIRDRETTAILLAHLAEVDARRLYVPAGYPSMFAYCVEALRFSEGAAYKRIRAARAARLCPALFSALAEGRLHLAAACLLAPYVTPGNADELIDAATHRCKSEVEKLLARRFSPVGPVTIVAMAEIRLLPAAGPERVIPDPQTLLLDELPPGAVEAADTLRPVVDELPPGTVEAAETPPRLNQHTPERACVGDEPPTDAHSTQPRATDHPTSVPVSEPASVRVSEPASVPVSHRTPAPVLRASPPFHPDRADRYLIKLTIAKSTHDKLRRAQVLLGHVVSAGDVAQVLDRALDALITQIERRKLGSAQRRQREPSPDGSAGPEPGEGPRTRYIPARIRRAIWERDQGQCTFIGSNGQRCTEVRSLEFDHVEPVARGGKSTVEGVRLRCRAHNQYEAERVFGAEFMNRKRNQARLGRRRKK